MDYDVLRKETGRPILLESRIFWSVEEAQPIERIPLNGLLGVLGLVRGVRKKHFLG